MKNYTNKIEATQEKKQFIKTEVKKARKIAKIYIVLSALFMIVALSEIFIQTSLTHTIFKVTAYTAVITAFSQFSYVTYVLGRISYYLMIESILERVEEEKMKFKAQTEIKAKARR